MTLQLVVEPTYGYGEKSSNPLSADKTAPFDFARIVTAFDTARAATNVTRWQVMYSLLDARFRSSDTAALGGGLAYQYVPGGKLSGLAELAVKQTVAQAGFGSSTQELHSLDSLKQGAVKLARPRQATRAPGDLSRHSGAHTSRAFERRSGFGYHSPSGHPLLR